MSSNTIRIFTDGASKGNPGSGGWGAVISLDEKILEIGGHEEKTTNNRMELVAAIHALSAIRSSQSVIHIYTDSAYLIGGITKWVSGWKKNGWITAQKGEVSNRDLWETLDDLVGHFKVEWHKVTGHADTPGNMRADEIASSFGEGVTPELYSGPRGGYSIDLARIGSQDGGRSRKAHSYISLVDGVVKVHKAWSECKQRVEGKSNVRFRKASTPDDEARIIQEFQK